MVTVFSLFIAPSAYAGIPIQEKKQTTQETVINSKEKTKKVSKFKQKVAQKVAKKIMKKQADGGDNKILSVILAILIPFVGVAVWQDGITKDFWITLLLTLLFYVPGLVYALYIILS